MILDNGKPNQAGVSWLKTGRGEPCRCPGGSIPGVQGKDKSSAVGTDIQVPGAEGSQPGWRQ